ncbi:MAG: metallophosphoesterase [Mucinivorans sp.]
MKKILFLCLFVVFSSTLWAQNDSSALILVADPYLQNPSNGGISVCWQTRLPCHSYVEWGVDSTSVARAQTMVAGQVIANNTLNKIRVEGLKAGQTYYYRIVSRHIRLYQAYKKEFGGTYRSPFYSFTLPADNQQDFDALVVNDLHQRVDLMDDLMAMVRAKALAYDFVVFNGDCVADPRDEKQAVGTISRYNSAVGASTHPVIYMRGNHEIRNAYSMDLTRLFDYVGGKSYGAMSWGDTRIVMLDCGEDKPDSHWVYYGLNDFDGFRAEQLTFLEKEHRSPAFRAAGKRILISHIPLWGVEDDVDSQYNPCGELWGPELAREKYDIALAAHMHAHAYYDRGVKGNPFPVIVGGGPSAATATVIHLQKRGKTLCVTCYNASGEVLYRFEN